MKRVNVFVCIQMDIPNQNKDRVSEVLKIVGSINESLFYEQDSVGYAQVLISDIDASNIVDQDEQFEIDDNVEVPDPDNDYDLPLHGFVGRIIDIKGEYAEVEDQEGDVFTVELSRLIKV